MEHGFTGHEHYDRFVKVRGERGKVKGAFGSKTLQQLISNSPLTFHLLIYYGSLWGKRLKMSLVISDKLRCCPT